MKRVVSLYFPTWPTDRIQRRASMLGAPDETPLVLVGRVGRRRIVTAADRRAQSLGVVPGMAATQAQALVAGLRIEDTDLAGDTEALERLALWALKVFSPIVAADPPNGILIDATGAAHLFGGEKAMLADIVGRLTGVGTEVRAAMAPTYGAAHALARYRRESCVIAGQQEFGPTLSGLPIAALRLVPEVITGLRALGFTTIGELSATPRAPLTLRFGPEVGRRLDQAYGRLSEPIVPVDPPELIFVERNFAEPISAPETLARYTNLLTLDLCAALEASGRGALRLDLLFYRVDNHVVSVRVGMSKPVRDAKRLARLLCEKLETVDPGFGIDRMALRAPFAENLILKQVETVIGREPETDVSELVDTLTNRLGAGRLYQAVAVESDVPERSVAHALPLAELPSLEWPNRWPRPTRLLQRPEPIETVALLPDHPPANFTWRGVRRRVKRADGPERIFGEWWKNDAEMSAVRDYFQVEDETGARFWLFRAGDGESSGTGSQRWFLHGVFG